jgi:hypothetical protein
MTKNILIVSSKPLLKLKKIKSRLKDEADFEFFSSKNTDEALEKAAILDNITIIYVMTSLSELSSIIELCGNLYDHLEDNNIKIIVISYVKHSNLKSILKKVGVEYLFSSDNEPSEITRATLQCFKKMAKYHDTQRAIKDRFRDVDIPKGVTKVLLQEPLEMPFDYWITDGKKDFKRIMGEWQISLLGPNLNLGTWVKSRNKELRAEGAWEWVIQSKDFPLFTEQKGTWVYFGERPQLKDDRWLFRGEYPELVYFEKGEIAEIKITHQDGAATLIVSRNSSNEDECRTLIYKSFGDKESTVAEVINYQMPSKGTDR